MNATLADKPVVRFGLGRAWATSTTTAGNEVADAPITSDIARWREQEFRYPVLLYYAAARTLPANCGKAFFLEEPADQAGFITDAIVGSTSVPHLLSAAAWGPLLALHHGSALPSRFYADEVLDWDASVQVAPKRPSGELAVVLRYAGRATPTPVEDPWD